MESLLESLWSIYQRFSPLAVALLFLLLAPRFKNPIMKALCWLIGGGLGIAFFVRLVLGLQ